MTIQAKSVKEYIEKVEDLSKQSAIIKLREVIQKNIPEGFEEGINYNMIGYYIPHSLYPAGYHCDAKQPLPFMNIAAQKNFVAIYHMGIYTDDVLLKWFTSEHASRYKNKLDMGKSCFRYKKLEDIPFDLIGELAAKVTSNEWIDKYESVFKPKK